ncbi:GNAT family N-acetyltransferase [bacterium]|nr:GNAT family N-acetyltransferase [bacterium]RQV95268.1 MAG: GNAT family N-acetyltransferase [bacterium]
MRIRHMTFSDIEFALACTHEEGWRSETSETFKNFLQYDAEGCFIAEEDHQAIGLCVGTHYGNWGFLGELIVIKEKRGLGIGRSLLNHTIVYLKDRGSETVVLDADLLAVPLYENVGFQKICRSFRFIGRNEGNRSPHVRVMQADDLDQVKNLDKIAFGADRSFFLKRIFNLHPEYAKVLVSDGEISGFILAQKGYQVISVGPWIALDSTEHPEMLFENLAAEVKDSDIRIGVLENNPRAVSMMKAMPFMMNQEYCWRMVLGGSDSTGRPDQVFAIGSGAKG